VLIVDRVGDVTEFLHGVVNLYSDVMGVDMIHNAHISVVIPLP